MGVQFRGNNFPLRWKTNISLDIIYCTEKKVNITNDSRALITC